MENILFLGVGIATILGLLYTKTPIIISSIIFASFLLLSSVLGYLDIIPLIVLLGLNGGIYLIFGRRIIRQKYFTHPILKNIKKTLPTVSKTEDTAINAGTVWFDKELFSGNPNWNKLIDMPITELTKEEKEFLEGPVEELCSMIDEWEISQKGDLSPKVWKFILENKFFGMVISKEYGGLEFSALAHSEVIAKVAGKSGSVATTIGVPNSLGPGELLLHYGTKEQKEYYLPRLAEGKEIPCFALTNAYAGSDATSIPDTGIVCEGKYNGKKTLGIKLNWDKRYITLAPIATVLGLAFQLKDPDNLLGEEKDVGITCALIPTDLPGITIGEKHIPLSATFFNGPTKGKDVFIPLDFIIGGPEMAGEGWRMLVECLSCGRSISIPSVNTGGIKAGALITGAYARIRKQFKQPISKFEGIQEALARVGSSAYISEATRITTTSCIDMGEKPSVLGAILKYHVSEMGRKAACDIIDIHGGKGIIQGPNNYVAQGYMTAPIGITVEGANILTRNLIIFGQGALRCHPYLLEEVRLAQQDDIKAILPEFDKVLSNHVAHTCSSAAKSFVGYITRGLLIKKPIKHAASRHYQMLTWASSTYNFVADVSMLVLGGNLKFKEQLSAKLGDMLSMLYIASCCLKKFEYDGAKTEDLVFVDWCVKDCLFKFWQALVEIIDNFPNFPAKIALKLITMPFGNPVSKPKINDDKKLAETLCHPNPARNSISRAVFKTDAGNNHLAKLEKALAKVISIEPIEKRLKQAIKDQIISGDNLGEQIKSALNASLLTKDEAALLRETYEIVDEIIAVDHFPANAKKKSKSIAA